MVAEYFFLVMKTLEMYSPSNCEICSRALLTIITVLCVTSSWVSYSNQKCVPLLPPCSLPASSSPSPTSGNHLSALCIYELICFPLGSTVSVQYLYFSVWLISLSIMPSSFVRVVANGKFSSLLWLGNMWYVCTTLGFPVHLSVDT